MWVCGCAQPQSSASYIKACTHRKFSEILKGQLSPQLPEILKLKDCGKNYYC